MMMMRERERERERERGSVNTRGPHRIELHKLACNTRNQKYELFRRILFLVSIDPMSNLIEYRQLPHFFFLFFFLFRFSVFLFSLPFFLILIFSLSLSLSLSLSSTLLLGPRRSKSN